MRYLIMLFSIISFSCFSSSPSSFNQAKKITGQLFATHPQTLYCQCQYQDKEVDLSSCGMESANSIKRAHRIEVEHIMAAEHFGQHFECWRMPLCQHKNGKSFKGRACCQKIDAEYRHIESELYNLWPEVGAVNQARSNYRFAMVPQKSTYYGCDMTIDKSSRLVEPPDTAKGLIARSYLFMAAHYSLAMSSSQRQLFQAWNRQFPPSVWECQWAKQVALIEGYDNEFITHWNNNPQLESKIAQRN